MRYAGQPAGFRGRSTGLWARGQAKNRSLFGTLVLLLAKCNSERSFDAFGEQYLKAGVPRPSLLLSFSISLIAAIVVPEIDSRLEWSWYRSFYRAASLEC